MTWGLRKSQGFHMLLQIGCSPALRHQGPQPCGSSASKGDLNFSSCQSKPTKTSSLFSAASDKTNRNTTEDLMYMSCWLPVQITGYNKYIIFFKKNEKYKKVGSVQLVRPKRLLVGRRDVDRPNHKTSALPSILSKVFYLDKDSKSNNKTTVKVSRMAMTNILLYVTITPPSFLTTSCDWHIFGNPDRYQYYRLKLFAIDYTGVNCVEIQPR